MSVDDVGKLSEDAFGVTDQDIADPSAKIDERSKDGDDLGNEGEGLFLDLCHRLKDGDDQADAHADKDVDPKRS